jgi:hypothetical protein
MTRLLTIALLLFAPFAQAAVAAPPPRVEIRFEIVTGSIKLGEGRELLEHDGSRYQVTSESSPTGIAALFIKDLLRSSRGRVAENGLKPEQFEERGRKGGRREARFDWPQRKLTIVYNQDKSTEALPADALDQASFPFSFAFVPPKSDRFMAHITDGKRLQEYEYRLVARETLKTPMGDMDTMHFEKVRGPDDKRGFEFWLAVDRHYLPVKLRYIEKDGRPFDSNVVDIRYQ